VGKNGEICFFPLETKKIIFSATIFKFAHPHPTPMALLDSMILAFCTY